MNGKLNARVGGSNNAAGAFTSPLKLLMAGSRRYGNGSLYLVGSLGGYWSSTALSSFSRVLRFDSGSGLASSGSYGRASGYSVRCIKN